MGKKLPTIAIGVIGALFQTIPAVAGIVTIAPSKDNTLYQDPDGLYSNGLGSYVFVGTSASDNIRRAVLEFDIAGNVPAGATINSVSLTMHMSRCGPSCNTTTPVSMYRVQQEWGEGASLADGQEGIPDNAAPGDATWLHTFFPDQYWNNPGGDFDPTASATVNVRNIGFYTWNSTPQMVADVQGWLNDDTSNHGWILIGDEVNSITAKRFDSKDNASFNLEPALTINYTEIPEPATILFVGAGMLAVVRIRRR